MALDVISILIAGARAFWVFRAGTQCTADPGEERFENLEIGATSWNTSCSLLGGPDPSGQYLLKEPSRCRSRVTLQ
jgi:hypothetical protein